MSAYFLGKAHIDGLVTFAVHNRLVERLFADATGQMLWEQNARSMAAAYPNLPAQELETYDAMAKGYTWTERPEIANLPYAHIVKMANCYDYQACETEDYDVTEACDLMRSIREAVANKIAEGCEVWEWTG